MISLLLALTAGADDLSDVVVAHSEQRHQVELRSNVILTGWGGTSILAGTVGHFVLEDEPRAFAQMTLAWGAVNTLIGVVGLANLRQRDAQYYSLAGTLQRDATLERVFWINAGADVAYLAVGGIMFMQGRRTDDPRLVGFGAAVAVQGWFLIAFDVVNALTHARAQTRLLLHPVVQDRIGIGMTVEL